MDKKMSIAEIMEVNNYYKTKSAELSELFNKTMDLNSLIDLDEVKNSMNYKETKELYYMLYCATSDKEVVSKLLDIMNTKKKEEYPEIDGVHYFPEIHKIDFLSENEKVNLDNLLKKACERPRYIYEIYDLDSNIIDFLCANEILEKRYRFSCGCNSDDCGYEYVSEKQKQLFYAYHEFDYDLASEEEVDEHEERFSDGYFEIGCWNGNGYEICDVKDFEDNVRDNIDYRIIKKPDMTLDNI